MAKSKKTKEKIKKQTKEEELQEAEEQLSTEKQREQTLDNILEFVESSPQDVWEIDLSLSSGQTQQSPSSLQEISEAEKVGLGKEETRETEEDEKPGTIYEQVEDRVYQDSSSRGPNRPTQINFEETKLPSAQITGLQSNIKQIQTEIDNLPRTGQEYEPQNIEAVSETSKMPWEKSNRNRKEEVSYKSRGT